MTLIHDAPSAASAASAAPALPDPVTPRPPRPSSLLQVRAVGGADAGRVWWLGMGEHTLGPEPGSAVLLTGPGVPRTGVRLTITADGRAYLAFPPRPAPADPSADDDAEVVLRTIRALKSPPPVTLARRPGGQSVRWPEGAELLVGRSVLRLVSLADAAEQEDGRPYPAPRPAPATTRSTGRIRVLALPAPPALPASLPLRRRLAALRRMLLGRPGAGADFRAALTVYRELRAAAVARIGAEMVLEWRARGAESPDPAALALCVLARNQAVWRDRGVAPGRLRLRFGALEGLSAAAVLKPGDPHGAQDELGGHWLLPGLPAVVDPAEAGVLGVSGPPPVARALARWLVLQAAVQRGPDRLAVRILADPSADGSWDWSGRLPHCGHWPTLAPSAPVDACDPRRVGAAVRELLTELDARAGHRRHRAAAGSRPEFLVVLDRASRLRRVEGVARILAEGPAAGIYVLCVDDAADGAPPECRALLRCDRDAPALTARGVGGAEAHGVVPDLVTTAWADRVAAALAENGYTV